MGTLAPQGSRLLVAPSHGLGGSQGALALHGSAGLRRCHLLLNRFCFPPVILAGPASLGTEGPVAPVTCPPCSLAAWGMLCPRVASSPASTLVRAQWVLQGAHLRGKWLQLGAELWLPAVLRAAGENPRAFGAWHGDRAGAVPRHFCVRFLEMGPRVPWDG